MTIFPTPVAFIAPYPEMAELARTIIKEFERSIIIEVGDLQEGLKKAICSLKKGPRSSSAEAEPLSSSNGS